ncbi:MAG: complex I NDUFA9 subunit family protein [Alphaproteobacteria bacterium]|nr:complex I NDUFA9 subunit family protein [Alphaproteobacteria bacterium]
MSGRPEQPVPGREAMKVLVLGAGGFIGRHVCARLLEDGHAVVGCVRRVEPFRRMFPRAETEAVRLDHADGADAWRARLAGCDAVVNAAGVIGGGAVRAVHVEAVRELLEACAGAGVRRFVQISAISAKPEAGTDYAASKAEGDALVRASALEWIVLRPSLVYAESSYGGTSVLRALAACPAFTPLPGRGDQAFSPIHVEDLAEAVSRCLDGRIAPRQTLEPCGPRTMTLAEIVCAWRRWLGLPPARPLHVPMPLIRAIGAVADMLGGGPMGRNAIRQIEVGNAGDGTAFAQAAGFAPAAMETWLQRRPAHAPERWHARLMAVRPLLRGALAIGAIGTAAVLAMRAAGASIAGAWILVALAPALLLLIAIWRLIEDER